MQMNQGGSVGVTRGCVALRGEPSGLLGGVAPVRGPPSTALPAAQPSSGSSHLLLWGSFQATVRSSRHSTVRTVQTSKIDPVLFLPLVPLC